MARHPLRSWSIILQQSWNLRLNTRGNSNESVGTVAGTSGGQGQSGRNDNKGFRKKDTCWRYNRGRCTFGLSCRFDHRCAICMKAGHGAFNCRKLGLDKGGDRHSKGDRKDRDGQASKPVKHARD